MRWERNEAMVVRALSFSKRTEDGNIVTSSDSRQQQERGLQSQTSFTSFDVKKSRRNARMPRSSVTMTGMTTTASSTMPNRGTVKKCPSPVNTKSLERPSKINKLVLRVPSDASEFKHCRVIHSTCVMPESETEGDDAQRLSSLPCISSTSPSVSVVSQACQTSNNYNLKYAFPADEFASTDLGSCSISSVDAVSTLSRMSTSFGDGFSTPTRMGSTTRLVQSSHKTSLAVVKTAFAEANVILKEQYPASTNSLDIVRRRGRVHTIIAQFERNPRPRKNENFSNDKISVSSVQSSFHASLKNDISTRMGQYFDKEKFSTAFCVLAFSASFGNLLRLPRMVYFHGGGVFLLVYVLMTFVFGLPLMFLEIGLGQFCQHGTVKLWRAVNLFRGVGYAKTLIIFLLAVSYSVQIATALLMLVYATEESLFSQNKNDTISYNYVSSTVSENTLITWLLRILFLSIVWFLVVFCLSKRGVTYRKAIYFLFTASIVLTIALFVNIDAQDATNGLNKLFTFNWTALADTQVWYFATVQMFFSLQLGMGCIGTCAGKIFPKTNALWVAACIISSSLIVGIAWVILVFIWLPSDFSTVFSTPEEFLFSVINQILQNGSNFLTAWLCYLLVFITGMFSLLALVYSFLIAASIEIKKKLRWRHLNLAVSSTACLLACLTFIPGVLSITHVIEHYVVAHGVLALTILELVGFAMIYGCSNVYNDFEFLIGKRLGFVWKSMWLVTPSLLFAIELCSAFLLPLKNEAGHKPDSTWQYTSGWILYLICWLIVIITGFYQTWIQVDYNLSQKLLSALKPSRNWGPVDPIYRHCWVQWRNRCLMTGSRDFTLKRRGTRDYTQHARNFNFSKNDSSSNSIQWPHSVQPKY